MAIGGGPEGEMTTAPNVLLAEALRLAERGWRVFPVHCIRSDGRCSCTHAECGSPGKHPHVTDWPGAATTDPETITNWWTNWPDANVGVCTGNGLLVVDVDPRHGGEERLAAPEAEHRPP